MRILLILLCSLTFSNLSVAQQNQTIELYLQLNDVWHNQQKWKFSEDTISLNLVINKWPTVYEINNSANPNAQIVWTNTKHILITTPRDSVISFQIVKHSLLRSFTMQVKILHLDQDAFLAIDFESNKFNLDMKQGLNPDWYKAKFEHQTNINSQSKPNITCVFYQKCEVELLETDAKKAHDAKVLQLEKQRLFKIKQDKLLQIRNQLNHVADSAMINCFGKSLFYKKFNLVSAVGECEKSNSQILSLSDDTTCQSAKFIYKFYDKTSGVIFFTHLSIETHGLVKHQKGIYSSEPVADSLFKFASLNDIRDSIKANFPSLALEMLDGEIKLDLVYLRKDPLNQFWDSWKNGPAPLNEGQWNTRFMFVAKQRHLDYSKEKSDDKLLYAQDKVIFLYYEAQNGEFFNQYSCDSIK